MYNTKAIKLTNNNSILRGIADDGYYAHWIYGAFGENGDGYNKGIHCWSVKAIQTLNYRCIGVTSEKNNKWIQSAYDEWIKEGYYSYFDGSLSGDSVWRSESVICVMLNCNNWTDEYLHDEKLIKVETVAANQNYYFVMQIECVKPYCLYQTVQYNIYS